MTNVMGYGTGASNLLSQSSTHGGGQFPASRVAKSTSKRNYNYATAPHPMTTSLAPDYVVLNNAGAYAFAYNLTASVGTELTGAAHSHLFITASIIDANHGPVRLDIQPDCWKDTADGQGIGSVGDVTFVYQNKV